MVKIQFNFSIVSVTTAQNVCVPTVTNGQNYHPGHIYQAANITPTIPTSCSNGSTLS